MADKPLQALLREAEGKAFRFTFDDGAETLAEVMSSSHVDADNSVVLLRVGASPTEPGYSVRLADIRSIVSAGGRLLYKQA
jgi:hypothetical protein